MERKWLQLIKVRILVCAFATSAFLLLSACSDNGSDDASSEPSERLASQSGSEDSDQAQSDSSEQVTPVASIEPVEEDPSPREVSFDTEDGITLGGTLIGLGDTAIIFSHMFPSDQTSWHPLAQLAADEGYLALAYDYRGYGASGGEVDIAAIERDVGAAYDFLRQRGAQRIVLIGASIGGSASIKFAASGPQGVVGLVVVSGPQEFQGLQVSSSDLAALALPSLWLSARNDTLTPQFEDMFNAAGGPDKSIWIFESSGTRGTFIFGAPLDGAELETRLLDFVVKVAPLEE